MSYSGTYSPTTKVDNVDQVLAADMNGVQDAAVDINVVLGTLPQGTVADVTTRLAHVLDGKGNLQFAAASTKVISSGLITVTQNYHRVDTQGSAASDDLDTITAMSEAFVLFLRINNSSRTVTIKHGTGNIKCASDQDILLSSTNDLTILLYDATLALWLALGMTAGVFLAADNTFTGDNYFNGGMRLKYSSINTSLSLDGTYRVIGVDASGASRIETLPDAATVAGLVLTIIKTDSSANTVTLTIDGSQTINGSTTYVLSTQYAKVTVMSDGTHWVITN